VSRVQRVDGEEKRKGESKEKEDREGTRGAREKGGSRGTGYVRHGGMKSSERRRTDVGRCFYERPAVCVDVNYIGGHEEQR